MKRLKDRRMAIVGAILLLISLTACSNLGGGSSPPPNPIAQQNQPSAPASPASPAPSSGPRPQFYDFADIPVPTEMDLVSKESYVFQSGTLKAGMLTFKGRVDVTSLINFFQMAMPHESWKPKGGFRYKRSVLIFEKPDKMCVINLYEKTFYSYAEIYVAPSNGQL